MPEVQDSLQQIFWDRRYVYVPDMVQCPNRVVLMRDPSVADHNYRLFIKQHTLQQAKANEVPTEKRLMSDAKMGGIWTDEDEELYEKGHDHIEFLENEISRYKAMPTRVQSIRKEIKNVRDKLRELTLQRDSIVRQSADYLAHEAAVHAILPRVVLDVNGEPLWPSEEAFHACKKKYPHFVMFLGTELVTEHPKETAELRAVAKSPEWRLVWCMNRENLGTLFNRPVGELNLNQKLLVYWSRVYDSVYEDPERPDQEIIEDDEKLDKWIADRDLKREEEKKERSQPKKRYKTAADHHERMAVIDGEYSEECTCGALEEKGKGLGQSRRHDDSCPYGTWRDFTREEKDELAAQIMGRNSPKVKSIMDKKQAQLGKTGMVQEQDLIDRRSREFLGSKTNVIPVHKR